ncbi:MAG: DUF4178 domain-containing protein [Hyphomicrobiales bacterium]
MGLFDFFKGNNKEPKYDILSMKVTDLKKRFVFEYDLATWEVQEEYTYDWGNNEFTKEFKISDGSRVLFLSVEDDDEVELCLMEKVPVRSVKSDITDYIKTHEAPPKELVYDGQIYYMDEEAPGYFNDGKSTDDDNWKELISWTYYDKSYTKVLNIEQWDEYSFEASVGKRIKEIEISNILPHE